MTNTFYTQTDITKSNSAMLETITTDELLKKITSIEIDIAIANIRKVKEINPESASFLKRKLPYFLGAKFIGDIRNSKNFEYISHFVIDIDHYGDTNRVEDLKQKLSTDKRLYMAFISPSGDGLKLVYSLSDKITSLKQYSDFYKAFSHRLAQQFGLENYIDFKTSDATRICFLSYDANVYLNKNNEPINPKLFVSDFDIFNNNTNESIIDNRTQTDKTDSKLKPTISNKQYKEILSTLNPKTPKREKQYVVPEVLYAVSKTIVDEFAEKGLIIDNISDINYGRKFKVTDKNEFAIFNVFYGKKGFTVVKTPVRNSNTQLLEVAVALCEHIIYTEQEYKPTLRINKLDEEKKSPYKNDRPDEENKESRVIKLKAIG